MYIYRYTKLRPQGGEVAFCQLYLTRQQTRSPHIYIIYIYIYIYMLYVHIYICIYHMFTLENNDTIHIHVLYIYVLGSSARFARAEAYGIILWDYIT